MTDEKPTNPATDSKETEEKPRHFIEVRGQRIEIAQIEPGQLALMRVTANRLARLDEKTVKPEEAMRAFEKAVQIVCSIPTEKADREWIEDLMLSREMDLVEALQVMEKATDAWTGEGNREQRRKATRKPARKAPAKKKAAAAQE